MNLQEVAAQLIKFRTETGNMREIERCMNFIRQQAEPLGAEVEIYRKDALAPVILLSNGKYRDFDVLVVGHIDVVPAADPMFVPYVKEGKMFGRGSLDMKSFAAVGLNSLEYVLKQQLPLKFGVLLSSDEEKAVSDWKPFTRQSRPQVQNRVGRRRCRRYRKNRRPLQKSGIRQTVLQGQGSSRLHALGRN